MSYVCNRYNLAYVILPTAYLVTICQHTLSIKQRPRHRCNPYFTFAESSRPTIVCRRYNYEGPERQQEVEESAPFLIILKFHSSHDISCVERKICYFLQAGSVTYKLQLSPLHTRQPQSNLKSGTGLIRDQPFSTLVISYIFNIW